MATTDIIKPHKNPYTPMVTAVFYINLFVLKTWNVIAIWRQETWNEMKCL